MGDVETSWDENGYVIEDLNLAALDAKQRRRIIRVRELLAQTTDSPPGQPHSRHALGLLVAKK